MVKDELLMTATADGVATGDEFLFISYRQGGDRYKNLTSGDDSAKQVFELKFEEDIGIFAKAVWEELQSSRSFHHINRSEIFCNNNPLNIEIGFGNGEFLTHLAKNNPNDNFIGLEVFKKVFVKAFNKIKRESIPNCKIIQFDAALIMRLIPDGSVSNIYVNFPDPWFKSKHKKRRLLKPYFIELLRDKLKADGVLHIATDHDDYASEIVENLAAVSGLMSIHDTPYLRKLDGYLPTKYYRKFVSADGAYFFQYKKS